MATEAQLRELARAQRAHFTARRGFVEELSKAATGKIPRFVLCGGRTAISK